MPTARLGRRGPVVTRLGLGGAPLGNLFTAVADDEARATVDAAWEAGIRLFDTAPLYGHGLSEQRVGRALAGRPRGEYVLSTKVGRLLRPVPLSPTLFVDVPLLEPVFDFSGDAARRSVEESLERLGLDRLDVVHVHDPDDREEEALAGAFPALLALRDEGVIGAVGCGMNQWQALDRFVQRVDLDCVLLAGRWTLLDRSGEPLLDRCADRGVGVIAGGVFNSGILADPAPGATYDYQPAPDSLVRRALDMAARCAAHGVALAAVAVQWPLRHPAVTCVVVGARSAAEVRADVAHAAAPVPDDLWRALDHPG